MLLLASVLEMIHIFYFHHVSRFERKWNRQQQQNKTKTHTKKKKKKQKQKKKQLD
jgi:hypothetical protein